MGKDSVSGAGLLLGILGLVALAYILDRKKCNNCQGDNPKNTYQCQYCGQVLQ